MGCRGACRARLSCRAAVAPPCRRTCQTFAVVDMLGCRGTCRASLSCRSAVAPPGQTVVSGGCRTSLLWRCCGLLRPVVITATSLPATTKTASLRSRLRSPCNTQRPEQETAPLRTRLQPPCKAPAANSNRNQHPGKTGCNRRVARQPASTKNGTPAAGHATPNSTTAATETNICAILPNRFVTPAPSAPPGPQTHD